MGELELHLTHVAMAWRSDSPAKRALRAFLLWRPIMAATNRLTRLNQWALEPTMNDIFAGGQTASECAGLPRSRRRRR